MRRVQDPALETNSLLGIPSKLFFSYNHPSHSPVLLRIESVGEIALQGRLCAATRDAPAVSSNNRAKANIAERKRYHDRRANVTRRARKDNTFHGKVTVLEYAIDLIVRRNSIDCPSVPSNTMGLPEGWVETKSATGQRYYHNTFTGETS